jgi:hypothetical protein
VIIATWLDSSVITSTIDRREGSEFAKAGACEQAEQR